MKIDTCNECKYFICPTKYWFYGHCLMNGNHFLPDHMSCERFESNEKSRRNITVELDSPKSKTV